MNQVLENRFRHILETENWLQKNVPETAAAKFSRPLPELDLSGGEDGGEGRRWLLWAAGLAFVAGVCTIAYGAYQNEQQKDD